MNSISPLLNDSVFKIFDGEIKGTDQICINCMIYFDREVLTVEINGWTECNWEFNDSCIDLMQLSFA